MSFPSMRMRVFLLVYRLLWAFGLPVVLLYLVWRSRKDPDYRRHLGERFGAVRPAQTGAVWVHAVSLGEFRSALPLIEALLDKGDAVHVTSFTPAGRREAARCFQEPIAQGRVSLSWVPLDTGWAWGRFLSRVQPAYGLVMEIEIWPRMVASAHSRNIPLLMCNAQYPSRSYKRDTRHRGLRAEVMTGFAGALVKSDLQRERFSAVGVRNIAVTGELRFDQPVPAALVTAGKTLRQTLAAQRPTICLASVIADEDELMIDMITRLHATHDARGLPRPFVIYVPRAPERFGPVHSHLTEAGLKVALRSDILDPAFSLNCAAPAVDILLGDSLGEMYGYLAMADRVVVGGGFVPKGAHNISEALALGKPVWTGPHVVTIEYPATEAEAAGVLRLTRADARSLHDALAPGAPPPANGEHIAAFFEEHSGATERTLEAIPQLLAAAQVHTRPGGSK